MFIEEKIAASSGIQLLLLARKLIKDDYLVVLVRLAFERKETRRDESNLIEI